MKHERIVRPFRNGDSQAVDIPRDFELPWADTVIRKDGTRLILEPARKRSLLEALATFETIEEEFPMFDDPLPEPVKL